MNTSELPIVMDRAPWLLKKRFEDVIYRFSSSINDLYLDLGLKIVGPNVDTFGDRIEALAKKIRELGPIPGEEYYDITKEREFADFSTYFQSEPKMMNSLFLIEGFSKFARRFNNKNKPKSAIAITNFCENIYVKLYREVANIFFPVSAMAPGTVLVEKSPYEYEKIVFKPGYKVDYYYFSDEDCDELIDTPYEMTYKNGFITIMIPATMHEDIFTEVAMDLALKELPDGRRTYLPFGDYTFSVPKNVFLSKNKFLGIVTERRQNVTRADVVAAFRKGLEQAVRT